MKTITLKIPENLDARIRETAARRGENISEIVRRALIREVEESEPDFAKFAGESRGMYGGPRDLSQREGYGDSIPG